MWLRAHSHSKSRSVVLQGFTVRELVELPLLLCSYVGHWFLSRGRLHVARASYNPQ